MVRCAQLYPQCPQGAAHGPVTWGGMGKQGQFPSEPLRSVFASEVHLPHLDQSGFSHKSLWEDLGTPFLKMPLPLPRL